MNVCEKDVWKGANKLLELNLQKNFWRFIFWIFMMYLHTDFIEIMLLNV